MRSFKFYISEALDNLIKNKLMSFASSITIASCIFILVISFCISKNISLGLEELNNSIGLCVIISDDMSNQEIDLLYKKICEINYISQVKFISKQDALKNFTQSLDQGEELLANLEQDNPLPSSFDIKLKDNNFYSQVISNLEKLNSYGIKKIKHASNETNILLSVSKAVNIISLVIIFILGLIAFVIIINTIKLAVNNRKDEISIMRYVGATNYFICWPFIIEGIIIGLIGAIISVSIGWLCYERVVLIIYKNFPVLKNMFKFASGLEIFISLTPIALSLGILVGMLASIYSLKKYLKV